MTPKGLAARRTCASTYRRAVYERFATGRCGHRPLRGAFRSGRTRRVTKYDLIGHSPRSPPRRPCTRVGAAIGRPRSTQLFPHHPGEYAQSTPARICIGLFFYVVVTADEQCSPLHTDTHPPVVAHDSQGTSCASHMRQHAEARGIQALRDGPMWSYFVTLRVRPLRAAAGYALRSTHRPVTVLSDRIVTLPRKQAWAGLSGSHSSVLAKLIPLSSTQLKGRIRPWWRRQSVRPAS